MKKVLNTKYTIIVNDIKNYVDIETYEDEQEQMNQLIFNYLFTPKQLRPFNLQYGTDIYKYLFKDYQLPDIMNLKFYVYNELKKEFGNYIDLKVFDIVEDDNQYIVYIIYNLKDYPDVGIKYKIVIGDKL